MSLFDFSSENDVSQRSGPLADRLRPRSLKEYIGFQDLIRKNKSLELFIKGKFFSSFVLWGGPGSGKTTLARLLAEGSESTMILESAMTLTSQTIRDLGEQSKFNRLQYSKKTVLFIDEIHRLNRTQQDQLLPFVERGDFCLIGATTENPSYRLTRALMSRCRLIRFEAKEEKVLLEILNNAALKSSNFIQRSTGSISNTKDTAHLNFDSVEDSEAKKVSEKPAEPISDSPISKSDRLFLSDDLAYLLTQESAYFLIQWSEGDIRKILNGFELVLFSFIEEKRDHAYLPQELIEILGDKAIGFDQKGEEHYDVISAFIKSIRGSDADAGLYYLARMIKGGEDPLFIARRLVILASEDVGNADPRALQVAVSALQATELVGLPEAGINLAQAVTYLASAPKSNRSYEGFNAAMALVEQTGTLALPLILRSSKTTESKELGYGKGYKYPHSYPRAWVDQNYLPDELKLSEPLYRPSNVGFEKQIQDYNLWKKGEKPESK